MRNTPVTAQRERPAKKRMLVVNCFFDDSREPVRRRTKIPQALGPVYLAGAFEPRLCEVRLYDEVDSGPLSSASRFHNRLYCRYGKDSCQSY